MGTFNTRAFSVHMQFINKGIYSTRRAFLPWQNLTMKAIALLEIFIRRTILLQGHFHHKKTSIARMISLLEIYIIRAFALEGHFRYSIN